MQPISEGGVIKIPKEVADDLYPTPKPKAKAKAKLLAIQDKPAASSEGTEGATKRNKGKQADVKIEEFKKLTKKT